MAYCTPGLNIGQFLCKRLGDEFHFSFFETMESGRIMNESSISAITEKIAYSQDLDIADNVTKVNM